MTLKTYTKRENAKRAAIAAGMPANLIQITVHKDGDRVRFGFAQKEDQAFAAPEVTTGGPVISEPAGKVKAVREPRIERNGVKRPHPGGACAAVWEYLDQHGNLKPKELKPVAEAKGWNVNNALIELYGWRKFMGLARAATR